MAGVMAALCVVAAVSFLCSVRKRMDRWTEEPDPQSEYLRAQIQAMWAVQRINDIHLRARQELRRGAPYS